MTEPNGKLALLKLVVGWSIVAVWAFSIGLDVFLPEYDPPPTIHLLMMLVAGAMFGPTITGRRK